MFVRKILKTTGYITCIVGHKDYLYIGDNDGVISVIDINDNTRISVKTGIGCIHCIVVYNDYLYVSTKFGDIQKWSHEENSLRHIINIVSSNRSLFNMCIYNNILMVGWDYHEPLSYIDKHDNIKPILHNDHSPAYKMFIHQDNLYIIDHDNTIAVLNKNNEVIAKYVNMYICEYIILNGRVYVLDDYNNVYELPEIVNNGCLNGTYITHIEVSDECIVTYNGLIYSEGYGSNCLDIHDHNFIKIGEKKLPHQITMLYTHGKYLYVACIGGHIIQLSSLFEYSDFLKLDDDKRTIVLLSEMILRRRMVPRGIRRMILRMLF